MFFKQGWIQTILGWGEQRGTTVKVGGDGAKIQTNAFRLSEEEHCARSIIYLGVPINCAKMELQCADSFSKLLELSVGSAAPLNDFGCA